MGYVVSSSGFKFDFVKIEVIVKMKLFVDKVGVERLRGIVNYFLRFVFKFFDVMCFISDLICFDVEWIWDFVYDKVFEEIKCFLI